MVTMPDMRHVVLHCHTVFHKDGHLHGHYRQTVTERYSIAQARWNLSRLVRETERGKAVALTRRVSRLQCLSVVAALSNWLPIIRVSPKTKRKLGGLEEQIWIAPDFDEIPQEVIDSFWNSKIFPDEEK
ncbi:MAG: hypothetical protein OXF39_08935 [Nitrospira sp.]|nr:hypothetical protein [Nitrospira sp.]